MKKKLYGTRNNECYNRNSCYQRIKGWLVLLGLVAILFLLIYTDSHIRSSATEIGYYPDDADIVVICDNFPDFLKNLQNTSAAEIMQQDIQRPLRRLSLELAQSTGIRLTAARWRVWLGDQIIASRSPAGFGICVYPGVLLRIIDRGVRFLKLEQYTVSEPRTFGDLYYAWHDGFLIVSHSSDFVRASLNADIQKPEFSYASDELGITWKGPLQGETSVSAAQEISVQGRIHYSITQRDTPLMLTEVWPDSALLSLNASRWDDIFEILLFLDTMLNDVPGWNWLRESYTEIYRTWSIEQPESGWDVSVDEISLAILDIDWYEAVPVPRIGIQMRRDDGSDAPHPLLPMLEGLFTFPYEWGSISGIASPLLSDDFGIFLSSTSSHWFAVSSLSDMESLLQNTTTQRPQRADMTLQIDWWLLSEALDTFLKHTGEHGLLPWIGQRDIEAEFRPPVQRIRDLGVLRMSAQQQDEWLHFSGVLTDVDFHHDQ